ncbi:MAG TPA: hypothetical protein VFM91_06050, partial [Propionibacteriaceae bacterium]|nr:hypothetical protein [Propionibacteriaceae bacterium]
GLTFVDQAVPANPTIPPLPNRGLAKPPPHCQVAYRRQRRRAWSDGDRDGGYRVRRGTQLAGNRRPN